MLSATRNRYNDLVVTIPEGDENFVDELKRAMASVNEECVITVNLPAARSAEVPLVLELGFEASQCNREFYTFLRTMGPEPPQFGTHIVRVEALVRNGNGDILVVKERSRRGARDWKLPSGNVEPNEYFSDAIVREMFEETGLRVSFVSLLGIGNRPHGRYGRNELYLVCEVELLDSEEARCVDGELCAVRWMSKEQVQTLWPTYYQLRYLERICADATPLRHRRVSNCDIYYSMK